MPTPTLKPLRTEAFDYWKAHHLVSRAGFGGSPDEVRALASRGLEGAVERLLDDETIENEPVEADTFDATIMPPLSATDRQQLRQARRRDDEAAVRRLIEKRQESQKNDRQQMREIQRWWMRRLIDSPRALDEKMTLFLHGHFATSYRGVQDSYHMFVQNQLFRAHATGNFKQLTHAIIRDPAMLRYLNNNQNNRRKPNENLARELMELFTLGEGHGYTEQDIREGARALTGYTYNDDTFVGPGTQRYRNMHDAGTKRILGRSGEWDGDDFVDIIFAQKAASEFICLKLYRFFVNDLPHGPDRDTQRFIVRLARRFRDADFELKPVLRTLFTSEHFYDEANIAAQIKSPVQLVVQSIRSFGTPSRRIDVLLESLRLMGQTPFAPPSVEGWDGGRSWINTSTLFVRQNTLVYLLTGRIPGAGPRRQDRTAYDPMPLVAGIEAAGGERSPRTVARYLLRFSLGVEPGTERIDALDDFVRSCGGQLNDKVVLGMLSLIAAMPEYQLC
jgi:uncharacterized protein (DUF1800 family)